MEQSEIWQHVKSGGLYRVSGIGLIEATITEAVIYQSLLDGQIWIRPAHEFYDGRFLNLTLKAVSAIPHLLNQFESQVNHIEKDSPADRLTKVRSLKKSPEQWLEQPEFAGVTIMDPDGWDRKNYAESWAEPLTLEEMQNRTARSTVTITADSPMHPANIIKEHTNV